MNYNYKNKFHIYHETGKFTEQQLKEILDAAYELGRKEGYESGYAAGKLTNGFSITYPPYWYSTDKTYPVNYNNITCKTNTEIVPTVWNSSDTSNMPNSVTTTATTTNNICREFRYNGTER